ISSGSFPLLIIGIYFYLIVFCILIIRSNTTHIRYIVYLTREFLTYKIHLNPILIVTRYFIILTSYLKFNLSLFTSQVYFTILLHSFFIFFFSFFIYFSFYYI